MNNGTFIEKAFYNQTNKERHGNLFKDSNNNIYSYGYHYPLLFTASDNDRLVFINTTGYSNSTSKHIGHAKKAVDYEYIGVELNGARLPLRLQDIHTKLGAQVVDIQAKMALKKRKNTAVYADLEQQLERVLGYYNTVGASL